MKYLIWGIYFILFLSLSIFFFYNFYFLKKTENQSLSLAKYYLKEDFKRVYNDIENTISKKCIKFYEKITARNYSYKDALFNNYFLAVKDNKSISIYPYAPFLFTNPLPQFVEAYANELSPSLKKIIFGNLPDSEKIWLIDSYLKDTTNPENIRSIVEIEKIKFLVKKNKYNEAASLLEKLTIKNWYESYYKYAIFLLTKIKIYNKIKNLYLLKKEENAFLNFLFLKSSEFENEDITVLLEQFKNNTSGSFVVNILERFKTILYEKKSYPPNMKFTLIKQILNEFSMQLFVKVKIKNKYKIYWLYKLSTKITTKKNDIFFGLEFDNRQVIDYIKNRLIKTSFITLSDKQNKNFSMEKTLPFLLEKKLAISNEYVNKRMIAIKNQRFSLLVVFLMVFVVSVSTLFFLYLSLKKERDLLKQKTEFINMISHELRTPLSGIILCAETINMGRLKTIDKIIDYSSKIVEQSEFLKQLINDILDFSRIEKGKTKILLKQINPTTFFNSTIKKYLTILKQQNITVKFLVDNNLPIILGDENLLLRVINNLIDNAIKYSPKEKYIEIKVFSKFDNLYMSIKDRGIGISKKYHKKIFHRFFRIPDSKRESVKGTGLGLSMVKRIIKRHHGKIYLQSVPNKGTTFTIVLPTLTKRKTFFWRLRWFLQRKLHI